MTFRLFLMLVWSGLAGAAGMALEWKVQELAIATQPFQQTQDVDFEFTNTGPKPVTIVDLQTNCDCLEAKVDQESYAPGASGHIKARFTIGDRAGLYERVITVVADDVPAPVRLKVRIEVPELFTASPRSVKWTLNRPAAPQFVDLSVAPGLEISFTEAQATNRAFTARLEAVEPGRRYRVVLQPAATTAPTSAAIRVFGREKSGRPVVASVYASVE